MTKIASKKQVMDAMYPFFDADERYVLLAGDMGFAVLDKYFINHPTRSFNIGINEQATVSMAAGLAIAGLKPIIYSQIPFITMRAFEQLRYDINEHVLDVKVVGVGADNYFNALGRSHCMDNDDIELISILKNIDICTPSPSNVTEMVETVIKSNKPSYIRSL